MNIFISSNMLDLLELADPPKARPRDRESPLKQQRFNVVLLKLRERNLHNEAFIRRFRQKAAKRRLKFPEITPRLSHHAGETINMQEEDEVNETLGSKCILPSAVKPKEYSQKNIAKVGMLKETNHTLTEDASSDDEKTISFPNFDFCPQETAPSPRDKPKPTFANLKQDKEFNKYLRNVFFKEISTKIQAKNSNEEQIEGKWKQGQPRRSMGRMKTEMVSSKYKLNIKSFIFGNMDPFEGKSQQKIDLCQKPKHPQIAIDRFKNIERYQRDVQFRDDKLSRKGLLPTIHNHQVTKNKRFLENYIKYNHHERPLVQPEIRTISLANSENSAKNDTTPNRIGLSLRIQTISVQKCS